MATAMAAKKSEPRAASRSASPRVKKAITQVTKKVGAATAALKKHVPKSKAAKLEAARERAAEIYDLLQARHPDAHCELDHRSPFELIVATVLSAQSTDVMVNKVTPELFKRFPDAKALAKADPAEVEKLLGKLGMFRQKTKSVIALSQSIVEQHGGEVPRTLAELVKLRGVGRKTANVVLGVAFGTPEGVVVDTHVQRLSQRLGLTRHTEPAEIEEDLMELFPRERWDMLSHLLIFHGRRVCTARSPACAACTLNQICPSAFKAELVGRKAPRERT
jgi:endonuclease-3